MSNHCILGRRLWTAIEDEFLRRHIDRPAWWCGRKLDRTPAAVECRRVRLGLSRPPARPWTPEESAKVLAVQPTPYKLRRRMKGQSSFARVAKELGRSLPALMAHRKRLLAKARR